MCNMNSVTTYFILRVVSCVIGHNFDQRRIFIIGYICTQCMEKISYHFIY